MGRPRDWAKGFDSSAPCSELVPVTSIGHPSEGAIWLDVNGIEKQRGDLRDLIWPVAGVIAYASHGVTLSAGDIIFTGAPAGVGALQAGDVVRGGVDGITTIQFLVGALPRDKSALKM